MSLPFAASVVFPTKNRRECLLMAIAAAFNQTVPVEVLVMDDGSSDGSEESVRKRFPDVNYHRMATGQGPAFQRNRGIALARAPIVFPLDDDAVLVSPHTVQQTLAEFDHPRIGAIGIPYVNVRVNNVVHQRAPSMDNVWVTDTYVGASHAVRRSDFLAVGGYREHFFYMGEEGDLTLRMLAAGRITRLGNADPIEHHESPSRDTTRANYFGRRNDVLFVYHNVPMPSFPVHLVATVANGLRTTIGAQHPLRMLAGLVAGLGSGLWRWAHGERQPVPLSLYHLHRKLKKDGPASLPWIESLLPPMLTTAKS